MNWFGHVRAEWYKQSNRNRNL